LVNSNNAKQLATQQSALKSLHVTGANISHNTITTLGSRNPGLTLNTITGLNGNVISGVNRNSNIFSGLNNLSGSVTWDSNSSTNGNVKKYEVFETSEDILALSVTWHRLRLPGNHIINTIRPTTLTDNILFTEINQEDRNRADIIRDYYSKKLMVMTLRGQRISKFRKDLNTFIHGDCKIVKEEMMPLIFRLPEFYDYDIQLQEMFSDLNKQFEDTEDQAYGAAYGGKKILKPMKKFVVKLRTNKFSEYWLKDDDNKAYKIEIPIENKLNHLWEHFFEQESIPLQGYFRYMERDGINYFHLKNWEIDFTKT
jgi:hypothetical protein